MVAIEIAKDGLEARQATRQLDEATFKGLLVNFAFWMKKLGYAESTIKTRTGDIRTLYYKRANLYDSESVKEVIANSKITNGTKHAYIVAYKTLARFAQIDLGEMPKYRIDKKAFYLPKKAELDMLIAGAGWKTGAFLQLLAETGARTIEAAKIKWPDVDSECKRITITNPAKNGKPRRLKVSTKLIEMLMRQPRQGQYVFGENAAQRMRKNFYWTRKHIVAKTANKNLQEIHLHSFRHFFATKLYLQTRDIRYVQKKLGHRNITSTTIYENSDPDDTDVEQYTIKAVTSKEDAVKLGELGYEPFDTIDEVKLYRKKVLDVA